MPASHIASYLIRGYGLDKLASCIYGYVKISFYARLLGIRRGDQNSKIAGEDLALLVRVIAGTLMEGLKQGFDPVYIAVMVTELDLTNYLLCI
jgi:hypothetical protein